MQRSTFSLKTYCKMMSSKPFLAVLSVVCAGEAISVLYPIHPSCKIKWDWPYSVCADMQSKLVGQMVKLNKIRQDMWLYRLRNRTSTQLKVMRATPVKYYADELTFIFTPNGGSSGCQVDGYSTPKTRYAVVDYSIKYFNLYNLITGAGLDKVSGYNEETSDSICTQVSSVSCDEY